MPPKEKERNGMNGTVLSLAPSIAERVSDRNHGDFNASAENALRNDADWTDEPSEVTPQKRPKCGGMVPYLDY